ncbi:substrate-binding periplasmic protein [Zooshikella harenae]|uniref:substrate-binding periplasmic protein n=1 Tax=Zooshikella harenae TaxID=2827238 RepID=UPI0035A11D0E
MQFRIATVRGYASEKYLLSKGFKQNVQIVSGLDTTNNIRKLINKRVDLILSTDLVLSFLVKNKHINPNLIVEVFKVGSPIKDFFGFNINTSDKMLENFQRAFDELVDSGEYEKIINKYLLAF